MWCTACTRLAENTASKEIARKSPSRHHPTTLSSYIFAIKAYVDNRKKNLLSSNISSTRPHNMVNFGPIAAEIVLLVWGTPPNFNGFRVLAALLHDTLVVGVSQTLRRWTEGAAYIRQGGHHVGHWPTFLVYYYTVLYRELANSWSVGAWFVQRMILDDAPALAVNAISCSGENCFA